MSELPPVESFAAGLVAALEPAARRELAREIARQLRQSQQKRIAAQLNPDGSAFEARKPQLRHQKGRLRRQMFAKLRTSRFMKADASPEAAVVSFTPAAERIARVHQFGLRDKVNRKTGLEVTYPARQLLGLSPTDEALVGELVTDFLADRL